MGIDLYTVRYVLSQLEELSGLDAPVFRYLPNSNMVEIKYHGAEMMVDVSSCLTPEDIGAQALAHAITLKKSVKHDIALRGAGV